MEFTDEEISGQRLWMSARDREILHCLERINNRLDQLTLEVKIMAGNGACSHPKVFSGDAGMPNAGKVAETEIERTCLGKQPHASESAAHSALRMYQAMGTQRTGDGCRPYRCPFCREWHLGH